MQVCVQKGVLRGCLVPLIPPKPELPLQSSSQTSGQKGYW